MEPTSSRQSGRFREQAVSRLAVPSGRGRLRRSGPPRPGTDRPARHGKTDASAERNSELLGEFV
jgi:hypothetical protein